MANRPRGVLIVTLQGVGDMEAKRKQISMISGVIGAEYSYLTGKLEVRYAGDDATLREIESQINKVLRIKQGSGH